MIRYFKDDQSLRRAFIWLAVFAAVGAALVLLYRDADQQDSGFHFLFARWAHRHPQYLVGVWARPLFTLLYLPFAHFGYAAAKFFTVIISLAAAWQTFRLARQIKFEWAELAIPLLILQPSFFLLSSTVLTETLFALVFVIALRLHFSERIRTGMIVASLLVLVRPEGFFIGVLWGVWVLFDIRDKPGYFTAEAQRTQRERRGDEGQGDNSPSPSLSFPLRFLRLLCASAVKNALRPATLFSTLLLATGMILWWLEAYLITGDPLWIIHDWPPDWRPDGKANGTGPIWWYVTSLPLIVGPLLIAPFIAGLRRLVKRREFICGVSAFLFLFVSHSLMFWRGWFGSAGYARYFVCVSPAIALITLAGWNELAERLTRFSVLARRSFAAILLAASFLISVYYVDGWKSTRDARAVDEMREWFSSHERPIARMICSQAYMWIVFDRDQGEQPSFNSDHDHNLALIRQSQGRTLVFWDEETGPKWYGLRADDFESAGFVRLKSQSFNLEALFLRLPWDRFGGPRVQQMHLLYKD